MKRIQTALISLFTVVSGFAADIPATASPAAFLTKAESAKNAYKHVLAKAGTIHRDAVEQRIVDEVRHGKALYQGAAAHKPGIIDSPADAGGWPVYAEALPVVDNDHDGMADDWERAHGLDPSNPDDRNNIVSKDGYTALDAYLCSLMGEKIQ